MMKYRIAVDKNGEYEEVEIEASSEDEAMDRAEEMVGQTFGTVTFTMLGHGGWDERS